ncbi:MAG: methylenetetrahydrofolate--tRNA-(uracil(54)-C(5))-methyltransferase (FADH(2)-oxidizing) TrmFO [Gemmatimonadales bacterium]|nr:methylenetetrahydrofolate--tRNA-(uracil(54)-C(5))-methyltransferase (FADH(2)-oxidizing) TrmFO [Gemmatimonadales bacterium]
MSRVTVVGGGLAGCEAAWALAERGHDVMLHEMRPVMRTPAHETDALAELVCSNSFKSLDPLNAHGLLKQELRRLGSLLMQEAEAARVPGGAALVVDRALFARAVHARVVAHPRVTLVRGEVTALPSPGIVATGPLTSDALAAAIRARLGTASLAFYDAIAPIVSGESLDHGQLYALSRWGKGDGDDYLNAPLSREAYDAFIGRLVAADTFTPHHGFDAVPYFEGCLPIEEMARRGPETLRFGPMKPVGLRDPRTGREPWAVVQLRREDRAGQMWNLVGFQTRLRIPAQQEVFRALPGLGDAEFLRFGSIHRNSYVNAPASLGPGLAAKDDPALLFAGQMTGVEGYTESVATGLLAGITLDRVLRGLPVSEPPPTTMLGALLRYLHDADPAHFQPMNANWGLVAPLDEELATAAEADGGGARAAVATRPKKVPKDVKKQRLLERAEQAFEAWASAL